MSQNFPFPLIMFERAKECADYWKGFEAGNYTLVLARYKIEDTHKRSRYSLFLFVDHARTPERCFNFEPDDYEGKAPVAFYGEHLKDMHVNHGYAPNDLTIEQFLPKALEWAARSLQISVQDITPVGRPEGEIIPQNNKSKPKNFFSKLFRRS